MGKTASPSGLFAIMTVHISIGRVSEELSKSAKSVKNLHSPDIRSNSGTCPTHSSARSTVAVAAAVAVLASR
jgi:hypothetical protein